jgi:hypothetical protein
MEELKEEVIASCLKKEIVTYKLVQRKGSWLEDINKNHDGKEMFSNTKWTIKGLPWDNNKSSYVDPLTEEEKKFFESRVADLNLKPGDFSPHKKDNFWSTFRVSIPKEGLVLNLEILSDYLKDRFLLAQKHCIAPDWNSRNDKATYKYVRSSQIQEMEEVNKKADQKMKAYEMFGKIQNNMEKMKSILRISGRTVSEDSTSDFLKAEIGKLIDNEIENFLFITTDKDFNVKVFLNDALRINEIKRVGKGAYWLGEDNLGNYQDAIDFFNNPKNSEIRLKIQSRVDATKR